jgi:hypothetical protein
MENGQTEICRFQCFKEPTFLRVGWVSYPVCAPMREALRHDSESVFLHPLSAAKINQKNRVEIRKYIEAEKIGIKAEKYRLKRKKNKKVHTLHYIKKSRAYAWNKDNEKSKISHFLKRLKRF